MAKKAETTAKAEKKETVKKTKAVKVEEPKVEEAPITFTVEVEEEVTETPTVVEVEEPKTVEEAIEAVDTELTFDEDLITETAEKIEEELEPIKEISEKWKEIEEAEGKLNEILSSNDPQKAENIIAEELDKAQELKEKIEKIINKPRVSNSNVTSWWNGMGYDF